MKMIRTVEATLLCFCLGYLYYFKEEVKASKKVKDFKVFWNAPTEHCQRYGVHFNLTKFKIIQNDGDEFIGDKIVIIYQPGLFPYYNGSSPVRGGIPQLGDVNAHLKTFRSTIQNDLPAGFNSIAVLDFEYYQPSYEVSPPVYKKASDNLIRLRHPDWTNEMIVAESERSFNLSARILFESLLNEGKKMRPLASWGYYHFPYCKNAIPDDVNNCEEKQLKVNLQSLWLYNSSGALFPSVYTFQKGNDEDHRDQVKTRLDEAFMLRSMVQDGNTKDVLPYFWYRYKDDNETLLSLSNLLDTLGMLRAEGADGAVIWDSSLFLASREKCMELEEYVSDTLGPLVRYLVGDKD